MKEGGILVGIIVAFDRLEKTPSTTERSPRFSVVGEVRKQHGVPAVSILTLSDIIEHLKSLGTEDDLRGLEEYR